MLDELIDAMYIELLQELRISNKLKILDLQLKISKTNRYALNELNKIVEEMENGSK